MGAIFMCLDNLSGCELVALSSTLAISLSNELSSDELATLGSFLTTLGDNLSLLALQSSNCTEKSSL